MKYDCRCTKQYAGALLLQPALVGNREFFAAFGAARSQHFAAVGSLHTLAETVY
jgi:hypothetical protein